MLGNGADIILPDTVFHKVLVKVIEMLGTDLIQFYVTDGFVDPGNHGMIPVQCGRRQSVPGFQIQHIFRVLGEGFVVIILITIVDVFLKFVGESLDLPLRLERDIPGLGRQVVRCLMGWPL